MNLEKMNPLGKMNPLTKGLALGLVHILMVTGMAGKYLYDRTSRPRVWARVLPYDPDMPIRGRYVRLQLAMDTVGYPELPPNSSEENLQWKSVWGTLHVIEEEGKLIARISTSEADQAQEISIREIDGETMAVLVDRIVFFIPEHVPDPSRRKPGEQLWAEVTLPRKGPPRPIRLGVKKGGVLTPLELD